MADTIRLGTGFYLLTAFLFCVAGAGAMAQDDPRVSVTRQTTKAQRMIGDPGSLSTQEYPALLSAGPRESGKVAGSWSKPGAASARSAANNEFWFYSADVLLFNDHDSDGHFHGIDLLFDADTLYVEAEVYVVVYLSLEGGPWNEYSVTDNFTLFGTSPDDEFQIVTELLAGYPTGSYDLLIELFDGYDDVFLASFGPADTSELAFLPLEDAERDTPFTSPPTVIVDGGGAMGWLFLLALLVSRRVAAIPSPES